MTDSHSQRDTCRSCGSSDLTQVLSLGNLPLSDGLLREADLAREEPRHPLDVVFCAKCTLVQILKTVPPEELFNADYPYFSSFSDALLEHSRHNVEARIAERRLGPQSQVVELASNDGYLLQYYVQHGIPVLGIDPCSGPAKAAEQRGVRTLCTFFTQQLADSLRADGTQADVVHANNVLAHVADTNGFVAGLAALLKPSGVAVIEVPYVKDLIDHCEFDTIYHEHLCYFSVTALDALFRRHGLWLNRVDPLSIHGGSLRLFVEREQATRESVERYLADEQACGLTEPDYYRDFGARVEQVRSELVALLQRLKAQGASIAAYGAAAKGAILLNYAGVGTDLLRWVADRNVHKQGRYMPGVHVPIVSPERIAQDAPDYMLILPWNFKDEIMRQQAEYLRKGGRFVVPIPRPVVLSAEDAT